MLEVVFSTVTPKNKNKTKSKQTNKIIKIITGKMHGNP